VNILLLKNLIYNVGGVNKKLNHVRPITYDIVHNCIAFCQLPITNYPLPITNYQLPITHYQLPITHYQLPITHYQLPASTNMITVQPDMILNHH
jgi:hypothetical protein